MPGAPATSSGVYNTTNGPDIGVYNTTQVVLSFRWFWEVDIRGVAYRRRQGLPVSLHLHQWLTTVGGPILTFSVTADGSFGRFGGPLARPCKQQLVARCVRHCVFWPKPVKENVASDGG